MQDGQLELDNNLWGARGQAVRHRPQNGPSSTRFCYLQLQQRPHYHAKCSLRAEFPNFAERFP